MRNFFDHYITAYSQSYYKLFRCEFALSASRAWSMYYTFILTIMCIIEYPYVVLHISFFNLTLSTYRS